MQPFNRQLDLLNEYRLVLELGGMKKEGLEHYDMLMERMRTLRASIAQYSNEIEALWKEKHAIRNVGCTESWAGRRSYRDICTAIENAERQLSNYKTQFWETNAVVREMKAEPKDLWGKVEPLNL